MCAFETVLGLGVGRSSYSGFGLKFWKGTTKPSLSQNWRMVKGQFPHKLKHKDCQNSTMEIYHMNGDCNRIKSHQKWSIRIENRTIQTLYHICPPMDDRFRHICWQHRQVHISGRMWAIKNYNLYRTKKNNNRTHRWTMDGASPKYILYSYVSARANFNKFIENRRWHHLAVAARLRAWGRAVCPSARFVVNIWGYPADGEFTRNRRPIPRHRPPHLPVAVNAFVSCGPTIYRTAITTHSFVYRFLNVC